MAGHPLLCRLILCHVSQAVIGHDPIDWVVLLFLDGTLNLRIHPRASDFFITCKLVDGKADVWCCVLAWRRDVRLGVHVSHVGELRLLCAWSLLGDGRDGR